MTQGFEPEQPASQVIINELNGKTREEQVQRGQKDSALDIHTDSSQLKSAHRCAQHCRSTGYHNNNFFGGLCQIFDIISKTL